MESQGCPKRSCRVGTSVAAAWMFLEWLHFIIVAKYKSRTSVLSLSVGESVSPREVMLQAARMTVVFGRTPPLPSTHPLPSL